MSWFLSKMRASLKGCSSPSKVHMTVILSVLAMCGSACGRIECWKFSNLSLEEQEVAFAHRPPNEQLDIALCGLNMEPSDDRFADEFVKGGEQNVPFLLQRLRKEKSETIQEHILSIFQTMAKEKMLKGKVDLYTELESVVDKMTFESTKAWSRKHLEAIRINL